MLTCNVVFDILSTLSIRRLFLGDEKQGPNDKQHSCDSKFGPLLHLAVPRTHLLPNNAEPHHDSIHGLRNPHLHHRGLEAEM